VEVIPAAKSFRQSGDITSASSPAAVSAIAHSGANLPQTLP